MSVYPPAGWNLRLARSLRVVGVQVARPASNQIYLPYSPPRATRQFSDVSGPFMRLRQHGECGSPQRAELLVNLLTANGSATDGCSATWLYTFSSSARRT